MIANLLTIAGFACRILLSILCVNFTGCAEKKDHQIENMGTEGSVLFFSESGIMKSVIIGPDVKFLSIFDHRIEFSTAGNSFALGRPRPSDVTVVTIDAVRSPSEYGNDTADLAEKLYFFKKSGKKDSIRTIVKDILSHH
jgi:hypothetical protein